MFLVKVSSNHNNFSGQDIMQEMQCGAGVIEISGMFTMKT